MKKYLNILNFLKKTMLNMDNTPRGYKFSITLRNSNLFLL